MKINARRARAGCVTLVVLVTVVAVLVSRLDLSALMPRERPGTATTTAGAGGAKPGRDGVGPSTHVGGPAATEDVALEESGDQSATDGHSPRSGGTLRLPGRDPTTLDPALVRDVSSAEFIYEIFSGLVAPAPDLSIVPDLASSWTVDPDGTIYTFTIRSDATFHDGRPVTPDDVAFSLERACDSATGSDVAATYLGDIVGCLERLNGVASDVRGVSVVGNDVVLTIDAPKSYFLAKLTYPTSFVVDRRQVGQPGWSERPNGTGPFRLATYVADERLDLERHEGYHGLVPYLDKVTFDLRPVVSVSLFENGELDATSVGIGDLERITDPLNALSTQVVEGPGDLSVTYVAMNVARPPFDDPDLREAIHRAIDPDRIARVVMRGAVQPMHTILPPGMPGHLPGNDPLPPDPAAARAALARSRYAGSTAPITITTPGVGGASPVTLAVIDAISETLGIAAVHEQAPWSLFQNELSAGEYGMWILGWSADYPDPQDFLDVLFHSEAPLNASGYADSEVDELLEAARVETDPSTRLALYQEAERRILAASPWVPMYNGLEVWLVRPEVTGFTVPAIVVPRLGRVWLR